MGRLVNVLLVLASLAGVFLLSLAVDRLVPYAAGVAVEYRGFDAVYGRNQRQYYKSCDFEFVARTNALGLRGAQVAIPKGERFRIGLIGSSYVYGWGVNDGETWIVRLESMLNARGLDAELVNLGRNGGNPGQYAQLARAAVPFLEADMVIVVLGQGCDVSWSGPVPRRERIRDRVKSLFPGLSAYLRMRKEGPFPKAEEVFANDPGDTPTPGEAAGSESGKEGARAHARQVFEGLTPEQRERFEKLGARAKEVFFSGEVNPGVTSLAMMSPTMYSLPVNVEAPQTQRNLGFLKSHLAAIKSVCEREGCALLVLSMPFCAYVNERGYANYTRVGFERDEGLWKTSDPDAPFEQVCAALGLPLLTATAAFREQAEDPSLFFEYDLHLASKGQALFAEAVAPWVAEQVGALQ